MSKHWDATLAALELDGQATTDAAVARMSGQAIYADLLSIDDLRTIAHAAELVRTLGAAQMASRDFESSARSMGLIRELRGIAMGFSAAKGLIPVELIRGK